MKFAGIRTQCLDVGHYNQQVAVVKNKARVLFTAVASLIQRAFDDSGDQMLQVIIDRQGGRSSYSRLLGVMFSGLELKVIRQDKSISSYELHGRGKTMRLHFVTKADLRYMPVSLASMTSKYVRELLVGSINSYFINNCRHLKPTAGYWQDGLRFIKDLEEHLPGMLYDREKLIRSR